MKLKGETIFTLLLLVIFAGSLYLSTGWSMKARLFPMLIVIAGLVLTVWLLICEKLFGSPAEKEQAKSQEGKEDVAVPRPAKQKVTLKGEITMILWVLGFLAIILVFGFWVAIAVFTPLFMPLFGKENWKIVGFYTVGIWLGIYIVFHVAMKVPLYGGILGIAW